MLKILITPTLTLTYKLCKTTIQELKQQVTLTTKAIQNQVHLVYIHGTIYKHVQNIILTTNKNIYKRKNGSPFPLPCQQQRTNFNQ